MQIIRSAPNESGAYSPVQTWTGETLPDGYYQIADTCNTSAMQTHAGFVTLTVEDGVVTTITGDDAAYQAWLASLPEPSKPEQTIEEKLNSLQQSNYLFQQTMLAYVEGLS